MNQGFVCQAIAGNARLSRMDCCRTATRLPVYLRQQRMDHELSGDRARSGCEAVLAAGIDQLEIVGTFELRPICAQADAKLTEKLNHLSFTHKKEFAVWYSEAKQENTRARRVEKMKAMLLSGKVIS